MTIKNHKIKALSIVMMFLMLLLAVSVPKLTAKADGVDDFIGRCYKVTLSRDADSDGYAYWRDILVNRKQDGSVVAHGFLFSPEYIDKATSNEQYVKDLYMLFMGREPEQSGYDYWCEKMANGESREQIFAGFANSKEYFNLCFDYGITAGYYSADYGIQQVNGVNLFVERMYQTSLDRLGDQGGQNDWVQALLEGRISGIECARSFVQSPEFINKGLSNEDYLKSLYKAFMGREYDQDGLNYWLDKMNNGYTRDEVFAGFANSPEFEGICAFYGIVRGNYTPTDIGKKIGEIVDFTMFIAMPGSEINDGNDIQEIIAEKTGVRVKETWLTGQTADRAVKSMLASGNLPDFIDGGDGMRSLYEAGKLVAWDPYLEKYPNLKEMFSDSEWNQFRQADGKIYWANVFNNTYGESKATGHNDAAFWIQVRVLEWAGYPEIKTLDEYFDLLERYYNAHPTFVDPEGNTICIIPYTILCDDWRYYCLESAPQFLDGYPNDGSVIVDPATMKIVDYNTTPTAKAYFAKLNEEYKKGIIDKEFATQTYDEYISKLCTGCVLGMFDQNWDFNYTITPLFAKYGLADLGCEYVPLGLTAEGVTEQRWHYYGDTINNSSGTAVTTSCKDPDLAFRFLNDILNQDIHDLRYWGVEGIDYLVDEDGMYYRTQEMRDKLNDTSYKASHVCNYSYMPQWLGTSKDGKNAMQPAEQASEFYAGLSEPLAKCFKAYNAGGYPDMIGSIEEDISTTHPWFPMWSWSNELNNDTKGGVAWGKMGETKHKWLPAVVMSKDFEGEWAKYMDAYSACKPEDFLNEAQGVLDDRMAKYEASKK